jgi:hypothetical protein
MDEDDEKVRAPYGRFTNDHPDSTTVWEQSSAYDDHKECQMDETNKDTDKRQFSINVLLLFAGMDECMGR